MMRFSGGDVLRFLRAHVAASVLAALAFAIVRMGLAFDALPEIGAIVLLVLLASIQIAIAGGGAAILAILVASVWRGAAGVIFPAAGAATALVLSVVVEQINFTFLAPVIAAGFVYGAALFHLAWRPALRAT